MSTIAQSRKEVDRSVQAALAVVERAAGSATETEAAVWSSLLALGRALTGWFFALRAARYAANDTAYEHGGLSYRYAGCEEAEVGTRFGKVGFERPVGRVPGAPRWALLMLRLDDGRPVTVLDGHRVSDGKEAHGGWASSA